MAENELPGLPARPGSSHKHDFGTVVIMGGGPTMIGAPCFAAAGALRAGAGIVRLVVPGAIMSTCLGLVPSAIGIELPADASDTFTRTLPPRCVPAVGPGLGTNSARVALIESLLRSPHPLVLDADALACLATLRRESLPRAQPCVLTPHAGEFARLAERWGVATAPADDAARRSAAAALAARTGAVVVLKGHRTVISDGASTWTNTTGNPALAIPGSGDVLTGIIAAFIAQGLSCVDAARLAVHVHGGAGDLWSERHGPSGLMAMGLADLLPEACARIARRD